MTKLEKLQGRIAETTKAARDKVDLDKANSGNTTEEGNPGAETRGVMDRVMADLLPQMKAYSDERNRFDLFQERRAYPDEHFFRTKQYWKTGGSMTDIMQTRSNDPYLQEVQKMSDEVAMLVKWMKDDPRHENKSPRECAEELQSYHRLKDALGPYEEVQKALSSSNTGEGAEWIPVEYSASLVDEVRLNTMVAGLFRVLPMQSNSLKLATSTQRPVPYIAGAAPSENSAALRASSIGTGRVSLDTFTMAVRVDLDYEFREDSIIPSIPIVREKVILGLADGIENAVINGDSTGGVTGHIDTGIRSLMATYPDDVRVACWDGLRKLCNSGAKVDFDTGTEAFTISNFRAIRKACGVYGIRPDEGAWVTSINGYIRMLSLSEVLTVDKIGSRATILSGQLAMLDGSPVTVSEYVRNDMNTSGIYDGATTTKTVILYVHRPSYVFGERRGVTVQMEDRISEQQHRMVATLRRDFEGVRTSTDNPIGLGYDIAA